MSTTAYEQYLESINNSDDSDSEYDDQSNLQSDEEQTKHVNHQLDLPIDDFDRFVIKDIDHRSINHLNNQSRDHSDGELSIDLDASNIETLDDDNEGSVDGLLDDESSNQSINQSTHASYIAESMLAQYAAEPGLMEEDELEQSINQSHNHLYNNSNNQSMNQSNNQSHNQSNMSQSQLHDESDIDISGDESNNQNDQPVTSFTAYLSRPSFLNDDEDTPVSRMSIFNQSLHQVTNPSQPSTPVIPRTHQRSQSNQLSVQSINQSPFKHPHYRSPSDFFAAKSGNLVRPTFSSPSVNSSNNQSNNHLNISTPQRINGHVKQLVNQTPQKLNQSLHQTPHKLNQSINQTPQKLNQSVNQALNQSINQTLNRSINSMSQPVSPTASIKRARNAALASYTTHNSPRSNNQSLNQSLINQSIDRLNNQLINQFNEPITRSLAFDSPARIRIAKPIEQIIDQSTEQTNDQSNNQSNTQTLIEQRRRFQSIKTTRVKRCYRYIHFECSVDHLTDLSSMNEQLNQLIDQSSFKQTIIRSVLQHRESNRYTWLLINHVVEHDDLDQSIDQSINQSINENWKQEIEEGLTVRFHLNDRPSIVQIAPP